MEVRKFDNLSEFAASVNGNDDFESGKYIAVIDVLGRVEQTAAFFQKCNWQEAVNEFFSSLTDEFCVAKLYDRILQSCENGVFNERDMSNAPYGLVWSIAPYDHYGGGCFVFAQMPKNVSAN